MGGRRVMGQVELLDLCRVEIDDDTAGIMREAAARGRRAHGTDLEADGRADRLLPASGEA
jgi:hypothetical protein